MWLRSFFCPWRLLVYGWRRTGLNSVLTRLLVPKKFYLWFWTGEGCVSHFLRKNQYVIWLFIYTLSCAMKSRWNLSRRSFEQFFWMCRWELCYQCLQYLDCKQSLDNWVLSNCCIEYILYAAQSLLWLEWPIKPANK